MKRSDIIKYIALAVILIGFVPFSEAQNETKLLRKGNSLYDQGKFKDAEMSYRKALEANKESLKGQFNLGDALYRQKSFDESSRIFSAMADSRLDKTTKAKILHNLGNSLLEARQYDKSIYAYKQSLLNNPDDKDTKYNLEYAKAMLKKQEEQQKQQNKNQQDQQKKDQQQNKDQQNKDQQNKNQQDQKKISKEDAQRMLEALKNDEKKTLEKVKKQKVSVQQATIEKDW